jgi:glycosyltransferase involved in cell wall biosynthesis
MRISVIIPSRLQINPDSEIETLFLDRAIGSVLKQTCREKVDLEIVVGLDPGLRLPERFQNLRVANGHKPYQAYAVNAAVSASTGELLAFLEDDDQWEPKRLEYGLSYISHWEMITSNNRMVYENGAQAGINDFPSPSGWLMNRATWNNLGFMNESIRFHVDTEYLGRAIARGVRRLHLVEAGAHGRPWLRNVARFSQICFTEEPSPLVTRTINPAGRKAQTKLDEYGRKQSQAEHKWMMVQYGVIPW